MTLYKSTWDISSCLVPPCNWQWLLEALLCNFPKDRGKACSYLDHPLALLDDGCDICNYPSHQEPALITKTGQWCSIGHLPQNPGVQPIWSFCLLYDQLASRAYKMSSFAAGVAPVLQESQGPSRFESKTNQWKLTQKRHSVPWLFSCLLSLGSFIHQWVHIFLNHTFVVLYCVRHILALLCE